MRPEGAPGLCGSPESLRGSRGPPRTRFGGGRPTSPRP